MADTSGNTIIIKKIKKGGHGHHGGAWKVAYADFVTAMMAFFLLLWLLSTTTDEQKAGISEYFTPTVGVRDSEGIGFRGGEKPVKEGVKKDDLTPMGIVFGAPTKGPLNKKSDVFTESILDQEDKVFENTVEMMKKAIEQDEQLKELKDNILIEETPEGLKITIMDKDKRSMFKEGSAELLDPAKVILQKITAMIMLMPQRLAITGHTDLSPTNQTGYSNWELSADRANSTRRFILQSGLQPERMEKVAGKADQELLYPNKPTDPANRRINIVLLKDSTVHDRVPGMGRVMAPPRIGQATTLSDEQKAKAAKNVPVYPIPGQPLQPGQPPVPPALLQPPQNFTDGVPREIKLPSSKGKIQDFVPAERKGGR